MLAELVIRDLALIEESALTFGPGLNAITGETGAGKSLLVGALELLLGRRPRSGLLRAGARRAVVEGRFLLAPSGSGRDGFGSVSAWLGRNLPQVLEEWGELAAGEERELVLSRILQRTSDGATRSRASVNHHPVSGRLLRSLAERLFEICGQNEHQLLLDPAEQLRLLDGFGGLGSRVAAYRRIRSRWQALCERALELEGRKSERSRRLELCRHQAAELSEIDPEPGEQARLVEERDLLRNAVELRVELGGLLEELGEREGALVDRLRALEQRLARWRERIGALEAPLSDLSAAAVHAEEASGSLRTFVDGLDLDPARLEEVEGRLAAIEDLERKHGVEADELARLARDLEEEIERLEGEEGGLAGLEEEIGPARDELGRATEELGGERRRLIPRLRRAVLARLSQLGLERADLDPRLTPRGIDEEAASWREALSADRRRFGERGADRLELLLAANPGEPARPLREVASCGEAARILLALRSVLAAADRGRTLVFDEVDAGVGGRLGPAVGGQLAELARHHQVVCITHLPAIAAAADRHLTVAKTVRGKRTTVSVRELEGDQRVAEVADMIAGGGDQATARAEALRLLGE